VRTKVTITNLFWAVFSVLLVFVILINLIVNITELNNINRMTEESSIEIGSRTSSKIEIDKKNNILRSISIITEDCKDQINKEKELYKKLCYLRENVKENISVGSANDWAFNFSDTLGKYHSYIYDKDYIIIIFRNEENDKKVKLYRAANNSDYSVELELSEISCTRDFKKGEKGLRIRKYKDILEIVNRMCQYE